MRDKLKLHAARPLDVLVAGLVRFRLLYLQDPGIPDPRDHEVAELLRLSVEGPDVPSQPVVDQRKRHDLALGVTVGEGVVLDRERAFLVDRPGHAGQHV